MTKKARIPKRNEPKELSVNMPANVNRDTGGIVLNAMFAVVIRSRM
jgi:hypothetical protein